jgi:DNA-binding NtrC family response regulator
MGRVETGVVNTPGATAESGSAPVLVACSSQAFAKVVHNELLALGYCLRVIRENHRTNLCAFNASGFIALLVGDAPAHYKNAHSLLYQLSDARVFVIFESNVPQGQEYLIRRCTDFSVWTCAKSELRQRLDKLNAGNRNSPRVMQSTSVSERLANLNLVGRSSAFRACFEKIKRFSRCPAPVLIEGETGTGKDLMARAIHYLSERSNQPFIPVNCGSLPESLFENELFGHERGAYTGAGQRHAGLIRQAEGGTLFLDEIDALSAKGQVALLRFLEEREYRPLGSTTLLPADVRVVAASNSDLQSQVQEGNFRGDLFFRLSILPIGSPPLRERLDDIELLAEHFMKRYRSRYGCPDKQLHPASLDWMCEYDWPGNIRELKSIIHREFLLAEGAEVIIRKPVALDKEATTGVEAVEQMGRDTAFSKAKDHCISRFERTYLCRLMADTGGNVTLAAKRARKDRRALGKLLNKHGIRREDYVK